MLDYASLWSQISLQNSNASVRSLRIVKIMDNLCPFNLAPQQLRLFFQDGITVLIKAIVL